MPALGRHLVEAGADEKTIWSKQLLICEWCLLPAPLMGFHNFLLACQQQMEARQNGKFLRLIIPGCNDHQKMHPLRAGSVAYW
jgi:hypothetical protein